MTLILVQKADGRVVGRCDARCHHALTPRCTCVCGGRYHGRNVRDAMDRVAREFGDIEAELRQEHGGDVKVLALPRVAPIAALGDRTAAQQSLL